MYLCVHLTSWNYSRFIIIVQLQKEFADSVKGDISSAEQIPETWENLLIKVTRKVEVECDRVKLEQIKTWQAEEEAIYANEFCGMFNVFINHGHARLYIYNSVTS